MQDNCFREYDNTLSAGDILYYNYYAVPFGELGTEYLNNVYRGKSVYSYDVPFIIDIIIVAKLTCIIKICLLMMMEVI